MQHASRALAASRIEGETRSRAPRGLREAPRRARRPGVAVHGTRRGISNRSDSAKMMSSAITDAPMSRSRVINWPIDVPPPRPLADRRQAPLVDVDDDHVFARAAACGADRMTVS